MTLTQIALVTIAAYCILLVRDLLYVAGKLLRIVSDKKIKQKQGYFEFCFTYPGRRLLKLTEGLQHKFSILSWQADSRDEVSLQISENDPQKTGGFYKSLMNTIFTKLRADAVFVITSVRDGSNNVEIQQAHSRNSWALPEKLNNYLVNFYHAYFRYNDQTLLGLRDGFQSKSLTGDFYLFGYRYVIALPINYANHEGKNVRGILWLGYNKNSEPLAHELNFAKDLCSKIENEFASQRIIEELSSKVKEEKVINKQREEFLAHVSHDIRSPLNNIRSIINLVRLEGSDKEQSELLDTALGNCYDVEEIINTILDYTRYQAGQLANKKEIFDLHLLAEEVIGNQKVEARLKNLELKLNCDAGISILLEADRKQIKRVLNNLVNNAIKYTRQGSIEVEIKSVPGEKCSIKVSDTGIGMNTDQLELLFTPFCRFHQNEAEGIGLGLTLTRILTELNNGAISVQSEAGQGSVFELVFACEISSKDDLMDEAAGLLSEKPVSSIEILLVDDNAAAVDSLSRVLVKMGFNVTKCLTVSDAISIVNYSEPDLLITDWQMPGGGAKRLITCLKMMKGKTRVCVLTGSNDEQTRSEIAKCGAEKIFCKSEDFDAMQSWLESLPQEYQPEPKSTALVA